MPNRYELKGAIKSAWGYALYKGRKHDVAQGMIA